MWSAEVLEATGRIMDLLLPLGRSGERDGSVIEKNINARVTAP